MDWIKAHRGALRRCFTGAVLIGLTFFVWMSVGLYRQRKATEAMIAAREHAGAGLVSGPAGVGAVPAGGAPGAAGDGPVSDAEPFILGEETEYQGKTYRRNTYVKAVLCIGVDRSGPMTERTATGRGGQADGVFLVAQDTARNQLKILMIPRDSMTDITLTDLSGNVLGVDRQHLTLAYGYGDGRERSCEYMTEAVSGLLGGLKIDHYMAVDMDAISVLNDAVGGVTVTVPTEGMEKRDPAFVKGSRVTLHGKQAEQFVRFRDVNRDNSALYRMDQQQEYIMQFFKAVQKKSTEDSRIVPRLFEKIQDNMVTDMGKERYLKMAVDGLGSGGLTAEHFYTVPGMGVTTDLYDEFYADVEALKPILLELFYREAG